MICTRPILSSSVGIGRIFKGRFGGPGWPCRLRLTSQTKHAVLLRRSNAMKACRQKQLEAGTLSLGEGWGIRFSLFQFGCCDADTRSHPRVNTVSHCRHRSGTGRVAVADALRPAPTACAVVSLYANCTGSQMNYTRRLRNWNNVLWRWKIVANKKPN